MAIGFVRQASCGRRPSVARERRPRTAEERELERELGRQFSEMLRQSYEASRFRAGIEWLQGSAGEGKPNDTEPSEASEASVVLAELGESANP